MGDTVENLLTMNVSFSFLISYIQVEVSILVESLIKLATELRNIYGNSLYLPLVFADNWGSNISIRFTTYSNGEETFRDIESWSCKFGKTLDSIIHQIIQNEVIRILKSFSKVTNSTLSNRESRAFFMYCANSLSVWKTVLCYTECEKNKVKTKYNSQVLYC